MAVKRKKAKAKAKKRTTKRGSGLAGFRNFIKSKTIGKINKVKTLEKSLKAAKKEKAAATKKAQLMYRRAHK